MPVIDPQEVQQRLALFQERAGFCYRNWNDLYDKWKLKMTEVVQRMKALRFDPDGHAIEVRLTAQDPAAGLRPSPGRLTRWHPPAHAELAGFNLKLREARRSTLNHVVTDCWRHPHAQPLPLDRTRHPGLDHGRRHRPSNGRPDLRTQPGN
jgi:hypothetical protein